MDGILPACPHPRVTLVPKSNSNGLKVFQEASREAVWPTIQGVGSLPEVLRAFRRATGWSLQCLTQPSPGNGSVGHANQPTDLTWSAPVNPGVGATLGHFRIEPVGPQEAQGTKRLDSKAARELASALTGMLSELLRTQHALWQREAELAAGVPLIPHPEEKRHLASRLQAVLRAGAEAVDCGAAGLYLLDVGTSYLKLRSAWQLPPDRMADPPRPLAGALADLEAMLGHAVVLKDNCPVGRWNPPEDFPSAVCVPVSTPTMILGTLWLFSNKSRDFTDREVNLVEVVAGRLASDLEREILLCEGVQGKQLQRQLTAAERMQRNQIPSISPLVDDWELAGWTAQAEAVGGDFHDWFTVPDGRVAFAVGDVMDGGITAALAAGTVKAALRSHSQYQRDAESLLRQVNLTLWTSSAGDQFASLFCGLLEAATGQIHWAMAGNLNVIHIRARGWQSLRRQSPALGTSPEASFPQRRLSLQPGETLLVFTDALLNAHGHRGEPLGVAGVVEPLLDHLNLPAKNLALLSRSSQESWAGTRHNGDRALLILKHRHP
jgi:serine phosphatase RsbU (regulator of sigma subunit)